MDCIIKKYMQFMFIKRTIFVTEFEESDYDDEPVGRTGER